jgi:hypothetical protein
MAAKAGWQGFSQSHFSKRTARNVNALILWVLRESILEQKKDLAFHADKVRFYNEQKKALRNHMARLRTGSVNPSATEVREGQERLGPAELEDDDQGAHESNYRGYAAAAVERWQRCPARQHRPSEHAPEIAADLADDFERVQDASRHGYGNHP